MKKLKKTHTKNDKKTKKKRGRLTRKTMPNAMGDDHPLKYWPDTKILNLDPCSLKDLKVFGLWKRTIIDYF